MLRRVNPREARRMMQRMGMSMDSIPEVTQVIVKTATKEIIIDEPEVAILNMQGQKMYQVLGGRVTEKAVAVEKKLSIPEEDIQLVAGQTGKSFEEAKKALEESGGDLAKAILLLQGK
ncbi:MAG: nascent polypeptide-associated complex protein [Candidatus Bathyarchaeia archaeon]|jgi:nascent polypeptide-associated complex subunit alpha|nr:nascent polypeptide-associated complex protein [Candidatus Bathyarchaeota archaeon A05DMB-4]MDH7595700.1 nascent polypeptide-associated complex protein [Candidatus Bathyarchaeota archaeon]